MTDKIECAFKDLISLYRTWLSGPATDVANASMVIGSLNQVFRCDSLVVGKECYAESDHSIVLGKRARDYVSFIQSFNYQKPIMSLGDSTFAVEIATLNDACRHVENRTLKIADRDGNAVDNTTFIVNCISKDETAA